MMGGGGGGTRGRGSKEEGVDAHYYYTFSELRLYEKMMKVSAMHSANKHDKPWNRYSG